VRLTHLRGKGFTLVELLISISIAGLLIYLALPNFTQFFANTNIRTAAETLNNGMKQAQGQAIKLNTPVQFVLDSSALPTKYQIMDSNNVQLDQAILGVAANAATYVVTPIGATRATFSGLGQIMATNPFDPVTPGSAGITRIDVSAPYSGSVRKLAVVSDVTKGVKLCDPAFAVPDPKACP
jgi:type IV fimbrial biogenesis protein FimT